MHVYVPCLLPILLPSNSLCPYLSLPPPTHTYPRTHPRPPLRLVRYYTAVAVRERESKEGGLRHGQYGEYKDGAGGAGEEYKSGYSPTSLPSSSSSSSSSKGNSMLTTLCKVVTTPRMWLYALYLGGTDAPFETFAGLWGVAYLRQVFLWSKTTAGTGTMLVVIVGTVCQLGAGPALGCMRKLTHKLATLLVLALVGVASFVPFILTSAAYTIPGSTALPLAYASLASLGVTVGSCTIIWSVISSDELCDGTKSTGIISGATNTLVIFFDAVVQQVFGAVLSANWDGGKNKEGEPVYSATAFSRGFMVLAGVFALAALTMVLLLFRSCCGTCCRKGRRGSAREGEGLRQGMLEHYT